MTKILTGDCREVLKTLPDASIHCCVTSPPYWGLRDYGHAGQIGLEQTPEAYVAEMVAVFREVWRVLREDGTLWLNLGDSYWGGKGQNGTSKALGNAAERGWVQSGGTPVLTMRPQDGRHDVLKPKDLVGIPWRVAFALQADGWYLRQDIIWAKPNPMPESVTDRCTKSHEYIFLLSKSARYYYDAEAIKEPSTESNWQSRLERESDKSAPTSEVNGIRFRGKGGKNAFRGQGANRDTDTGPANRDGRDMKEIGTDATRNKRDVWTVCTQPYNGAHFATFPRALIEPMILAGCPSRVCALCGAPWVREVEIVPGTAKSCPKTQAAHLARGGNGVPVGTFGKSGSGRVDGYTTTIGFFPSCPCANDDDSAEPAISAGTVLDPFGGSGTTGDVASGNGRDAILIELNPEYVKLGQDRCGLFVQ